MPPRRTGGPRAVADHPDLAVRRGECPQGAHRSVRVAEETLVGNAACRTCRRRRVVGARVGALPVVQVRADRRVPVDCELAGYLLRALVPTRVVVDDQDTRESVQGRGDGPGRQRSRLRRGP